MKSLLFLCTGNYYRSRFSEEYFNYLAKAQRLPWHSYSRALLPHLENTGNEGPISIHTLMALEELNIPTVSDDRYPITATDEDFETCDLIIALDRTEHHPMVKQYFPQHEHNVKFFSIGDVHVETPLSAISRMTRTLDDLLTELSTEQT